MRKIPIPKHYVFPIRWEKDEQKKTHSSYSSSSDLGSQWSQRIWNPSPSETESHKWEMAIRAAFFLCIFRALGANLRYFQGGHLLPETTWVHLRWWEQLVRTDMFHHTHNLLVAAPPNDATPKVSSFKGQAKIGCVFSFSLLGDYVEGRKSELAPSPAIIVTLTREEDTLITRGGGGSRDNTHTSAAANRKC